MVELRAAADGRSRRLEEVLESELCLSQAELGVECDPKPELRNQGKRDLRPRGLPQELGGGGVLGARGPLDRTPFPAHRRTRTDSIERGWRRLHETITHNHQCVPFGKRMPEVDDWYAARRFCPIEIPSKSVLAAAPPEPRVPNTWRSRSAQVAEPVRHDAIFLLRSIQRTFLGMAARMAFSDGQGDGRASDAAG